MSDFNCIQCICIRSLKIRSDRVLRTKSLEAIVSFNEHIFFPRNHYVEYLCFLIRENNIDPITILSTSDLETVIRRSKRRLPVRPYFFRHDVHLNVSESIFHRELLKV